MAEIVAQLLSNAANGQRLKVTATGRTVTRTYEANTADLDRALEARNAPRVGMVVPELKGMVCLSVTAEFVAGRDESDGSGGATHLTAEFGRNGSGTIGPVKVDGGSWSELIDQVSGQTVFGSWYAAPLAALQMGLVLANFVSEPAINNGQGMEREVSISVVRIHRYYSNATFNAQFVQGLLRIRNTLNSLPITLAPLYTADGVRLDFAAQQVRLRTFSLAQQGDLLELILECVIAPSHRNFWRELNERGQFVGAVKSADLYPPAAWPAGLFA